jgi:hypothetical protein
MRNEEEADRALGALLRGSARAPDEAFVSRVAMAVAAEQRMAARRRSAWGRFCVEAGASAAVAASFVLIGRLSPASGEAADLTTLSPAMAAGLLLLLWLAVGFRPSPREV